jgi:hypothetical protein
MRLFKVTNNNNVISQKGKHTALGGDDDPWSNKWISVFPDIYMAAFCNPINGCIKSPHICVGEGIIDKKSGILKFGTKEFDTKKIVKFPSISFIRCIEFALTCVYDANKDDKYFSRWAIKWLSGIDRTEIPALKVWENANNASIECISNAAMWATRELRDREENEYIYESTWKKNEALRLAAWAITLIDEEKINLVDINNALEILKS